MNKKYICIGIVLTLLIATILFSGCIGKGDSFEVMLSDISMTINSFGVNGNESMKLLVFGDHNIITVNSSVDLTSIQFFGSDSIVYVSRSHNCTVENIKENRVEYYD